MNDSDLVIAGCLVVLKKDGSQGGIFPIHSETIIGQNLDCDIRISNSETSNKHARILPENDEVKLYNLSNEHQTFVNDKPIGDEYILHSNDKITIGSRNFLFTKATSINSIPQTPQNMKPRKSLTTKSSTKKKNSNRGSLKQPVATPFKKTIILKKITEDKSLVKSLSNTPKSLTIINKPKLSTEQKRLSLQLGVQSPQKNRPSLVVEILKSPNKSQSSVKKLSIPKQKSATIINSLTFMDQEDYQLPPPTSTPSSIKKSSSAVKKSNNNNNNSLLRSAVLKQKVITPVKQGVPESLQKQIDNRRASFELSPLVSEYNTPSYTISKALNYSFNNEDFSNEISTPKFDYHVGLPPSLSKQLSADCKETMEESDNENKNIEYFYMDNVINDDNNDNNDSSWSYYELVHTESDKLPEENNKTTVNEPPPPPTQSEPVVESKKIIFETPTKPEERIYEKYNVHWNSEHNTPIITVKDTVYETYNAISKNNDPNITIEEMMKQWDDDIDELNQYCVEEYYEDEVDFQPVDEEVTFTPYKPFYPHVPFEGTRISFPTPDKSPIYMKYNVRWTIEDIQPKPTVSSDNNNNRPSLTSTPTSTSKSLELEENKTSTGKKRGRKSNTDKEEEEKQQVEVEEEKEEDKSNTTAEPPKKRGRNSKSTTPEKKDENIPITTPSSTSSKRGRKSTTPTPDKDSVKKAKIETPPPPSSPEKPTTTSSSTPSSPTKEVVEKEKENVENPLNNSEVHELVELDYENMTNAELKKILSEHGLHTSGNKSELITRLEEMDKDKSKETAVEKEKVEEEDKEEEKVEEEEKEEDSSSKTPAKRGRGRGAKTPATSRGRGRGRGRKATTPAKEEEIEKDEENKEEEKETPAKKTVVKTPSTRGRGRGGGRGGRGGRTPSKPKEEEEEETTEEKDDKSNEVEETPSKAVLEPRTPATRSKTRGGSTGRTPARTPATRSRTSAMKKTNVDTIKEEEEENDNEDGDDDEGNINYNKYTVYQLKDLLTMKGLSIVGKKADLIERLKNAQNESTTEEKKETITTTTTTTADEKEGKDVEEEKDYSKMTVLKLKELLSDLGLSTEGKKQDLIDRLNNKNNNSQSNVSEEVDTSENNKEKENDKKEGGDDIVDFNKMTVIQLKELLTKKGLETSGIKSELIARLKEAN